jgi:hypothetical protein
MSIEELEIYAKDGTLPEWFKINLAATGIDAREGRNER